MKTKFAILLLMVSSVICAHAQSTVVFTSRVTDSQTGQPVSSPEFLANIYWAPGANPDPGIFVRLGGNITLTANGTFSGGQRTVPTVGQGPNTFYATAWETAFGPSYEVASQVQGARVGKSQFVTVDLPGPPPGPTTIRIPDFQVSPVPEPSTIALGILGLGSVLLFRRRRS